MFENLSDKLQRAFKNLRGQGKLTEENIGEALREIRLALLEADVNVKVVKQLIDQVKVKALGTEVMTALSPAEQIVKVVRDELMEILGKDTARLKFASQPPSVVLMAGLQGSGKTTTSGKLAAWLKKGGHRPMLVSVDVYRPAAREQLKIVAEAIKANLYEGKVEEANTATVERLAKEARRASLKRWQAFHMFLAKRLQKGLQKTEGITILPVRRLTFDKDFSAPRRNPGEGVSADERIATQPGISIGALKKNGMRQSGETDKGFGGIQAGNDFPDQRQGTTGNPRRNR